MFLVVNEAEVEKKLRLPLVLVPSLPSPLLGVVEDSRLSPPGRAVPCALKKKLRSSTPRTSGKPTSPRSIQGISSLSSACDSASSREARR